MVSRRPAATVVVATHGRPELLRRCLDAIVAACGPEDEVIVAASGGSASDFAHPGVRVLMCGDHRKDAKVNLAAVVAANEVIVLTDDDCMVEPRWVAAMAAPFGDPSVAVAFGPVDGLSQVPGSTPSPRQPPGPAPPESWVYAHGASMAVRRQALVEVGGFDERLGPGASSAGEEADLVLRLQAAGWLSVVADAPTVRHVDWRDDAADRANQLAYERGAGVWVGAGLRRDARHTLKATLLRLRYQMLLYQQPARRGWRYGPRTSKAFLGGVAEGLGMRPRRFVEVGAATRPPRVLWVTDEPPDIHGGGGNIRQYHMAMAFCERADTRLLVVGDVRDERLLRAATQIVAVPAPPVPAAKTKLTRRLLDLWLATGQRGPEHVFRTAPARRALRPHLPRMEAEADVVIVNHHGLAPLISYRRRAHWLFHLHNAAADQVRQELTTVVGRRQRFLVNRQLVKATRLERRAARDYDGLVVVSEEDAASMAALAGGRLRVPVWVAPNGVDTNRFVPTPLPAEPRVVLTATLGYLPNVDGALWFCDEVWPLILEVLPTARFDLVGRSPVPSVLALADRPGVAVHPDVPSTVEWLHQARVAVIPLRIGTGTRLKALEAMAAGRPVVGTTTGLAGIGVKDGVHALVRDDAASFAAGVIELLRSDTAAEQVIEHARALVEQRFRWESIGAAFADGVLATIPSHFVDHDA